MNKIRESLTGTIQTRLCSFMADIEMEVSNEEEESLALPVHSKELLQDILATGTGIKLKRVCPNCGGSGEIPIIRGDNYLRDDYCSDCQGKGTLERDMSIGEMVEWVGKRETLYDSLKERVESFNLWAEFKDSDNVVWEVVG